MLQTTLKTSKFLENLNLAQQYPSQCSLLYISYDMHRAVFGCFHAKGLAIPQFLARNNPCFRAIPKRYSSETYLY